MKISDVQTHTVNNGTRNYTFVTVTEENGLYGIGESGCSGKDNAVAATVEHYRPLLIGQDPSRIEHIWQDHFRGNFWRAGPCLQRQYPRSISRSGTSPARPWRSQPTNCWAARRVRKYGATPTLAVPIRNLAQRRPKRAWTKA